MKLVTLLLAALTFTSMSVAYATKPIPKYDRDEWLPSWPDLDGDCINERHELLISTSLKPVKMSNNGCYVQSGYWLDPYTGKYHTQARDMQIEHLVSLVDAHYSGGYKFTLEQKRKFALDRSNLRVVYGQINQDKSGKRPSKWMPPLGSFQCEFATTYKQVKAKYGLSISQKDQKTLSKACN
ncbi:hypothetical protein [Motilimonas eburnea]|uniref:hypothetical protein n=1 Tax=Motilimonas eburnea TaxID=1737488 RepID=UPI001E5FCE0D|nr:hypothetical protein [Motilimonas eburnea]MCE2571726.1 hypothetical protein [Motilimonas eburnea]